MVDFVVAVSVLVEPKRESSGRRYPGAPHSMLLSVRHDLWRAHALRSLRTHLSADISCLETSSVRRHFRFPVRRRALSEDISSAEDHAFTK